MIFRATHNCQAHNCETSLMTTVLKQLRTFVCEFKLALNYRAWMCEPKWRIWENRLSGGLQREFDVQGLIDEGFTTVLF